MLLFDIETNGLLKEVNTVFCMSIYDTEAQQMHRYDPETVGDGIRFLQETLDNGGEIGGHNVIAYDIPALEKVYPKLFHVSYEQHKQVVDTLVLARLFYSNIDTIDLGYMKSGKLPKMFYKSQKLMAWGYRLGILKGTYGEQEDAWLAYNPEMLEYNEQDVWVTKALYEKLMSQPYSKTAITLEHQVAWLMAKQERNGFKFDIEGAKKLAEELEARQAVIQASLLQKIPELPDKVFVPKRDNKRLGYKKGAPIQRYKPFNPNSRQQIEYVFRTMYGYNPENVDLYDIPDMPDEPNLKDYRLKMDDETLSFIQKDEACPEELKAIAGLIQESLMLKKRLGQIKDGSNAWLDAYDPDDGCIHGRVVPNGAVSGRATHSSPNVAQVPHVGSPYGAECRQLWNAGDWWQAGIDACGLELRCLAHFMAPYDDGKYAHTILNGDIHTMNQQAAGLPERNQAKTFIYAFLYGAGDAKIGKIIGGDATEGKAIKRKFLKATPAIKSLRDAVQNTLVQTERGRVVHWKRHYLRGLDGRLLWVRSPHSALNLLLQSAGALVCKKWIVRTEERLLARGLKHGWDGDFAYMAWVHDEIQVACRTKEIAKIVVKEAQEAMRDAQEFFKFRMQLDTEGIIGKNWCDCH
ncbi:MAG: ribonuclease H-like domain-containing protein [Acidaminococcus intestini]|uniref:DNA-directed DNA polymerase n=1 Tax=Acidaminococcus intestini TaxID=187327 RepID=A0A943EEN5_9FIRM|nr:ribonuclease H-like domain-containing protein [Acidaminococcus intestini]